MRRLPLVTRERYCHWAMKHSNSNLHDRSSTRVGRCVKPSVAWQPTCLKKMPVNPIGQSPRGPRSGPRKRGTPHLASLEQQLRLSLGTKTEIRQHNNGRGKIVINFSNPEEFERLFALVCPQIAQKAA